MAWEQVEGKYMTLAKDLLAYEKDRTQPWLQHAHAAAVALMRQPVLIQDPQSRRSCSLPSLQPATRRSGACRRKLYMIAYLRPKDSLRMTSSVPSQPG